MTPNQVWIFRDNRYPPPHRTLSFSRIRAHIYLALKSQGIDVCYSSLDSLSQDYKVKNLVFLNNLTLSSPYWDMIKHRISLYSKNRIYYGVTEGFISKPPTGYRIIVPSRYVAEECERINLKYESIIPHGFDPDQFKIDSEAIRSFKRLMGENKILFYCLGRYNIRKGLDELFQAVRLVREEIGHKFLVYIRTGMSTDFSSYIKELRDVLIINNTIFKASDYEIALEMSACDCYLSPNHAEAFCLPALESAYGCGKPVIYPNVSPFSDYLSADIGYPISLTGERMIKDLSKPYSYRMRYWDISEFANAMVKVIENPEEAKKKGDIAYKKRDNWTIYETYKNFKHFLTL